MWLKNTYFFPLNIWRILHGNKKKWILCSRGKNNVITTSGRSDRTSAILFLPLEHIIHIFSLPCGNLYIYHWIDNLAVVSFIGRTKIRFNIWSKKDEPIRAIFSYIASKYSTCMLRVIFDLWHWAPNCRGRGQGFRAPDQTNTQGLKITREMCCLCYDLWKWSDVSSLLRKGR